MKRIVPIAQNEYYHIYNRGNNKQDIFRDNKDRIRFLCLILYFQSPLTFSNLTRFSLVFMNVQHPMLNKENRFVDEVVRNRFVELTAFCLMSNHFHILVYGKKENGIPLYMQRVLNAYTKYFNKKYNRSGHLFQGPYQAVHQKTEEQLFYTTAYMHRNCSEVKGWAGKEHRYPWSSYQDYVSNNRWGDLLKNDIINSRFIKDGEYKEYVDTVLIKDISVFG